MDEIKIKQTIDQLKASIVKAEAVLSSIDFEEYCDTTQSIITIWEEVLQKVQKGEEVRKSIPLPITVENLNNCIKVLKDISGNENKISDGYHTFDELYEFRKVYNATLFNEWAIDYMRETNSYKKIRRADLHPEIKEHLDNLKPKYNVHKSLKHNDGELCFGGGWFIVVAVLPDGQISNHYKMEDWDLFKIPEKDKALFPFDGHTGQDVINRLKNI